MEQNIVIFGASKSGLKAYELIQKENKKNEIYFCDNNKMKELINGVKVLNFEELISMNRASAVKVIIASSHYEAIMNQCTQHKIMVEGIYYLGIKQITPYESLFEQRTFSQDGEDVLLKEIFQQEINSSYQGTYIDVGAHHPYRFSNTYWAYEMGWKGINIEPNPDVMELFYQFRERDINLNIGIGDMEGKLPYYRYQESAFNAFNKELRKDEFQIKDILMVQVRRLEVILAENNIANIDFMSIDVEGFEIEVLQSNDWTRFRPKYILLEQLDFDIEKIFDDELYQYMKQKGYKFHSKYNRTIFYVDNQMSLKKQDRKIKQ